MSTGSQGSVWREFEHDPRDPTYSGMRASERDRDVVREVLASSYADGRLDREELDERTAAVAAAKTYADLVPPLSDLTADAVPSRLATQGSADLRRSAEVHYSAERREALFGFLVPNLVCWAIWYLTGHDYFIWPIFVSIPTTLNLLRVLVSRQEIVEKRLEKLQRRQRKELEAPAGDTPSGSHESGTVLRDEPSPDHIRRDEA